MNVMRSGLQRPSRKLLLGAALLLAAIVFLMSEYHRRSGLYWYDVRADHQYALTDALILPVTLEKHGFTLPQLPEQKLLPQHWPDFQLQGKSKEL